MTEHVPPGSCLCLENEPIDGSLVDHVSDHVPPGNTGHQSTPPPPVSDSQPNAMIWSGSKAAFHLCATLVVQNVCIGEIKGVYWKDQESITSSWGLLCD